MAIVLNIGKFPEVFCEVFKWKQDSQFQEYAAREQNIKLS